MFHEYLYKRSFYVSIIILIFFSIVCTRIPLLNYLGFEFSAITVLLSGLISGLLTLSFWKQYSAENKTGIWQFLYKILPAQSIIFLAPLLISLANAVFIKNCSISNGIILYSLIVLPGMIFSISLAMFIGVICEKLRKTLYMILYIIVLSHILIIIFFRPQVFVFNPIIGFFSGFTYDETLRIIQRLIIYRLAILAVSGCILALAELIHQIRLERNEQPAKTKHSPFKIEIPIVALLGPIVVVVFSLSDRLGLSSSEDFIRQKLIGEYKTKHFDIIYPAGSISREYIKQLGGLHEFYFDKLSKELNINGQECITSFIYVSPEQKGRLLGAANTDIAKPWLRQIHINLADVESVLKHELVHVLAAEFGWSFLKAAPNSGLIEGLAVAMERTSKEEPLDRAAALAFAGGMDPDLESLFTPSGFFKTNANVSYTLAGSFCRFMIDSFGVEKIKHLYQTGQFNSVYQKDLRSLLKSWQSFIKSVPLSPGDSIKAMYFFNKPPIFGKECMRVLANLNADTKEYLYQHEFEKALFSAEKSLELSYTPEAVSQKAAALFELQRFQDVVKFVEKQLLEKTNSYSLLPVRFRLGDAYFALDSTAKAKKEYEKFEDLHLNSWYNEACALRLELLNNFQDRTELRNYFIRSMDDTVRIAYLVRLNSRMAKYLLAREYYAKGKFIESAQILESLGPMQSKTLEYFLLTRYGKTLFRLQNYEKARSMFEQTIAIVPNAYLRMDTNEWIERCIFMQKNLQ